MLYPLRHTLMSDACMRKGVCVEGDLCCIHCDIHSCQTLVWGRVFVLREICVVSTATDACMWKGICVDGDLYCIHCDIHSCQTLV